MEEARDLLSLRYIPLGQAALWDDNPKLHDVGGITQSIKEHGFKDPPRFEPELNGGRGGLVEGNGRVKTLLMMKAQGEDLPRGLDIDSRTGDWVVPVLFGVDAESEEAAKAYAVDHNNLTILGGDFTAEEVAKMWDAQGYPDLLVSLAEANRMPVSVDGDDLDGLLENYEPGEGDDRGDTLEVVHVSIGDPGHVVKRGDVWWLDHHVLICTTVFDGWPDWVKHLDSEDVIFAPFPGPFVPLSLGVEDVKLVMVQPDTYVCGHILDQYARVHGDESVRQQYD